MRARSAHHLKGRKNVEPPRVWEKRGKKEKREKRRNQREKRRRRQAKVRPFAGIFGLKTRYDYPRKERTELLRRVQALRKRVGVEE